MGINLRPHDLRRFSATYASRAEAPIEIVSKVILRHANLSPTQRILGKSSSMQAPCRKDRFQIDFNWLGFICYSALLRLDAWYVGNTIETFRVLPAIAFLAPLILQKSNICAAIFDDEPARRGPGGALRSDDCQEGGIKRVALKLPDGRVELTGSRNYNGHHRSACWCARP
jgi:hypothetical protein